MGNVVYIYGLRDPNTGEIKYVGKTINPRQRLGYHMNEVANERKREWIEGLRAADKKPIMVILEECDNSEGKEAEYTWIFFFLDCGCALTNWIYPGYSRLDLNADIRRRRAHY